MPRIVVMQGEVVDLTKNIVTIGRALDNDIVLQNQTVSRYHAYLQWSGETYQLIDGSVDGQASTSGTHLMGLKTCLKESLNDGESFTIGAFRLKYFAD
jgi:pSer/pThr/pTyr-binding forkhead associated (FHA) protein